MARDLFAPTCGIEDNDTATHRDSLVKLAGFQADDYNE